MAPAQLVEELEWMDNVYYSALPPMEELARLYGDPAGQQLYQDRDLRWKYNRLFRAALGIDTCDVTDESGCGSLRF